MNKYIKYSFVAVVILVVGFGVYGMNNYNTQPAVERRPKYIPVRCILKLFRTNLEMPDMWNEFGKK
jgi:hypothetical protein